MGNTERRLEILKLLCRRRYEKIGNLASEFGVSKRTISRDIEYLSLKNPIYTQSGKYGGGIYILDSFTIDRMYMTDTELNVLKKLNIVVSKTKFLTEEEKKILASIISDYSKPQIEKGNEK